MQQNKTLSLLVTLLYALIGGWIFQLIHMPIPWLIGSMVFVLIGSKAVTRIRPYWPVQIRNTGMIIVGYTIGLSFTMETLQQISQQLPAMILLTVLLLLLAAFIAFIVSKLSGIPYPTLLMGSIPGGLSQMIPLAEETKGVDITVVTFLQVSRLMMIVFFVPLLIFSPLLGSSGHHPVHDAAKAAATFQGLSPHIFVFAIACTLCAILGNKVKMPTAFMLAPMIITIIINLSGYSGPQLPQLMLNISQVMLGTYIGLMLKPEALEHKVRFTILALLSGFLLIGGSMGMSYLLANIHHVPFITAFLSLSPGGMDQMALIAKEVNADLSIVVCYQLFRILFIFIAVPPLIRLAFKTVLKKQVAEAAGKRG
ncbi:AbrB family transcriptional regulator [Metabacillus sp. GX 13764]|uniref:AbrB family transcriptional regulator n=1 Tax=Metabacillus kandeliae TaxID=2900151 RepID=UPI001E63743D|nr:AbrB family transcriptional regulator [Metabacillus kandeliae]MCD7034159.1 AbrB family transcriptional regulator [Metabacillus kandeliae]